MVYFKQPGRNKEYDLGLWLFHEFPVHWRELELDEIDLSVEINNLNAYFMLDGSSRYNMLPIPTHGNIRKQ